MFGQLATPTFEAPCHYQTIDIHVTHDLHLLALRLGWFGIPPNKKWISYLGGFAFSIEFTAIFTASFAYFLDNSVELTAHKDSMP